MAPRIRIGIVGVGDIARSRYLPELAGLVEAGDATLQAVCDADPARAERTAEEYGAAEAYDDYEDLLASPEVDLVVDTTPKPFHGEINVAAVEAGKHLYTEKPIATERGDADRIVEVAEEGDVRVAAAPPRILHPTYQYLRKFLAGGGIGEVAFATTMASHEGAGLHKPQYDAGWFYDEAAGGALYDMGIYGIQRLVYLLGPAERVTALSSRKQAERYVGYFDDDGEFVERTVDAGADDNTLFLLDFGDGTFGFVAATHNVRAFKGPRLQLFGPSGTACVSYADGEFVPALYLDTDEVRGWIDDPLPLRPNADLAPDDVPPGHDKSGFAMDMAPDWARGSIGGVAHLVECVAEDREPVIDARLARHCFDVMDTVQRAAETGERLPLSTTFEPRTR
jgi:predicted dehydrogenase